MDDQAASKVIDPGSGQQPPVRRRLGRGLNALLGGGGNGGASKPGTPSSGSQENHAATSITDQSEIHVELIEANPFQPRKDFDEASLAELAESIRIHGVLQPLLVRPHGGAYQLIAGERRLMASRRAGAETVPCRVVELDDQRMCEAAIEENMKRKDLNVLEKARAFRDYIDRFGCTIEELGRQLSLNRSTVSNYLRLLDLPEKVRKALSSDKITNGHARALLPLEEEQQLELTRRIQQESLSVRRTEEIVRSLLKPEPEPAPAPPESTAAPVAEAPVAVPMGSAPTAEQLPTADSPASGSDSQDDEAVTLPFPGQDSGNSPAVESRSAAEPAASQPTTAPQIHSEVEEEVATPAVGGPSESTRNHIQSVQQQLQDDLGLKLDIRLRGESSGQFVLSFHDQDEFDRILALLRRSAA
ncbi:MAG: ParB/RepB/Spo0J family partition protein [Planctomycetaceae bacterium]|nr:ParB/RepB/Spo0J family partition protein [Planctomycetaceae bacterium]